MNDWFDAEQHAERAHRFAEAGQWEQAYDALNLALSQNPHKPEWHYGLGLTLDAMERYEEAIVSYQRAVDLDAQDIGARMCVAVNHIRIGKPHRAIKLLEEIEALQPGTEATYCQRIAAYTQLGDHEKAEEMFYLARQIEEECPICYDFLAQSLSYRSEFKRAIWCWQQTLRLDPSYPSVRGNLARIHMRMGNQERARRLFLRQLRVEPGDLDTLLQLAYLLIDMGYDAEGAEKLRQALELDPALPEAHAELGQLALQRGHVDAAERRFKRAKRLDPQRPGINLGLSIIAHKRGQLDEARRLLIKELDALGQSVEQLLDMTRLFIELDLPEEALDALITLENSTGAYVISDENQLAHAYLYGGIARLKIGDIEMGVAALKHCLQLRPENAQALRNMVLAYIQMRDMTRARAWLRRLKQAAPHADDYAPLAHRLRHLTLLEWWGMFQAKFRKT
ncbi:TPR repeat-containing protein YrrB [Poriferisphaera corsica]|uniref:TPR repeat-containing protein YrrB n=1 Tax=Poriferisphaera corsica TaxID=2528020 RepID=A0A517YRS6_9BACT|nr:tetratricopeptide repeat protein [Poriferisphaera corsica]QDU32915.1 TPR repeat-containing protein YrrB [Poriferisphaera corsica]